MDGAEFWYVPSLSCRTLVYKGMLLTEQLEHYFPDLRDPAMETALALVHSRFSTNTFPSWDRAHPYRYIAHNGEINTLRGNINWMHARAGAASSPSSSARTSKKILPIINPNGSDSAMFDNALELLVLAGPLAAARDDDDDPRAMGQPRDDGRRPAGLLRVSLLPDGAVGRAGLDRLHRRHADRRRARPQRPAPLAATTSPRTAWSSWPPRPACSTSRRRTSLSKGRLQPGRMFLVDTEQGRIIEDEEIKSKIASRAPLPPVARRAPGPPERPAGRLRSVPLPDHKTLLAAPDRLRLHDRGRAHHPDAHGPRRRRSRRLDGQRRRAGGALERPRLLYEYFKQLFAQVTNPPIDCIREEIVMAPRRASAPRATCSTPSPRRAAGWSSSGRSSRTRSSRRSGARTCPASRSASCRILFRVTRGEKGLAKSVEELLRDGPAHDRGGRDEHHHPERPRREPRLRAVPALLAVAGLHHHLIREGLRTRVEPGPRDRRGRARCTTSPC